MLLFMHHKIRVWISFTQRFNPDHRQRLTNYYVHRRRRCALRWINKSGNGWRKKWNFYWSFLFFFPYFLFLVQEREIIYIKSVLSAHAALLLLSFPTIHEFIQFYFSLRQFLTRNSFRIGEGINVINLWAHESMQKCASLGMQIQCGIFAKRKKSFF